MGQPKETKLVGDSISNNTGLGGVPLVECNLELSGVAENSIQAIGAFDVVDVGQKDMIGQVTSNGRIVDHRFDSQFGKVSLGPNSREK